MKFTLVKRENIAKNIDHFYFKATNFNFKAGNYVIIKIGEDQRPFTISSAPEEDLVRITIKKVGTTTEKIFDVKEGEDVEIEGPYGLSFDERFEGKDIVFICGGTGITPSLAFKSHIEKAGLNNKFKVFYSVAYEEEIIPCDAKITITREEKEGYDFGRIDEEYLKKNLSEEDLEKAIFITCGPPKFEKEIKRILSELGAKDIFNGRS